MVCVLMWISCAVSITQYIRVENWSAILWTVITALWVGVAFIQKKESE